MNALYKELEEQMWEGEKNEQIRIGLIHKKSGMSKYLSCYTGGDKKVKAPVGDKHWGTRMGDNHWGR